MRDRKAELPPSAGERDPGGISGATGREGPYDEAPESAPGAVAAQVIADRPPTDDERTAVDDTATPGSAAQRPSPEVLRRRRPHAWWALAGFIAASQLAGVIGIPATDRSNGGWYAQLDKPPFQPPSWVFGPVWTVLYLTIGVAASMVWSRQDSRPRLSALRWFWIQLALNAAWTPIFFGLRRPGWALAEMALLWVAVAGTARWFFRADRRAGWTLVPYCAWIVFAGMLNLGIVVLDR